MPGQPIVVVVVEDDLALLHLNKQVLEYNGYRVLTAKNLKEARERMEGPVPDLLVLDLELPDGSGLDFCRELRKTNRVPVILLTSLDGEAPRQAGYKAGADDYITKPYRIERLIESVRALTARCSEPPEAQNQSGLPKG